MAFRRHLQPVENRSEETLVEVARSGDSDALEELLVRHGAAVSRFLRDLLRSPEAARDAAQETFMRASVMLPRSTAPLRFKSWLIGIARNVVFEMRRQQRMRRTEPYEDDPDVGVPDAVIPSPDPESLLLDRELQEHFSRALAELSDERRAALLMRLDHGMSYEDIAASFGWTLPTVKNEIHRARLKIRAALLPHLGG